ncbi:MAG: bifunctional diaminohydroxyphosphoribosylaminopyrimidine deaminase/5-amino-6-(5-phosphoribosylamino)uracil reductase RibD [Spirochaetaceae bacterium]
MVSDTDNVILSRTLELAARGGAAVRPNPLVGAVLTQTAGEETAPRIIATGYHAAYGGPHAEAAALEQAGPAAHGATLYCNLEPCSFRAPEKHNPPCTELIIAAGVSRVVIGQLDPNRRVRGTGVAALRAAGIRVDTATDFAAGWYLNADFNTRAALDRPFVTLKLASSLDGRIAVPTGDSKWITDSVARAEVHALRADHDAVLIGAGTAAADDPALTVRPENGEPPRRQPRAVVVDSRAELSPGSRLVRERARELIVFTADPGTDAVGRACGRRAVELTRHGVTVVTVAPDSRGRLPLRDVLAELHAMGIRRVLVEGGARIATALIAEGLYDAAHLYVAPLFLGGDGSGLGALGLLRVADAPRLEGVTVRGLSGQAVFEGFRSGWLSEVRQSVREAEYVYGAR